MGLCKFFFKNKNSCGYIKHSFIEVAKKLKCFHALNLKLITQTTCYPAGISQRLCNIHYECLFSNRNSNFPKKFGCEFGRGVASESYFWIWKLPTYFQRLLHIYFGRNNLRRYLLKSIHFYDGKTKAFRRNHLKTKHATYSVKYIRIWFWRLFIHFKEWNYRTPLGPI